jgi:peptidoglycan/LPS O-acetylase OafA/YrhL
MNPEAIRPQLPALTSIRFLAAAWVAVFHAQAMRVFFGPEWFQLVASIGDMGVHFFFVLSGFIMVYTYSGRLESWRDFWQARFARIYPALLFSLLLMAPFYFYVSLRMDVAKVVPEWVWPAAHLKLSTFLALTLLQTWIPPNSMAWHMPTWSLSNEAFFYFLFPFLLPIFVRFSRKQLLGIIPACFIIGAAASGLYNHFQPDGPLARNSHRIVPWLYFVKFNPLSRVWEFLLGMACGTLFISSSGIADSSRNRQQAWPFIAMGVALASVAGMFLHRDPNLVLHPAVIAPAFAAIIYGVALRPIGVGILEHRFFVLLGEASYSFYLLHAFVINAFSAFFRDSSGTLRHQNFLGWLLLLATTALVSIGAYMGIERPMRRILRPKPEAPKPNSAPLENPAEAGA